MDYEVLYFFKMLIAFGFTYFTYYKTKDIINQHRIVGSNDHFHIEELDSPR